MEMGEGRNYLGGVLGIDFVLVVEVFCREIYYSQVVILRLLN